MENDIRHWMKLCEMADEPDMKQQADALFATLKAKAKQSTCSRCNGTGRLNHQGHVANGVCFKCHGAGKAWNQAGLDALALREFYKKYYQPSIGTDREPSEARALATMLRKLSLPPRNRNDADLARSTPP